MRLTEKTVKLLQTDGRDVVIVDDAMPGFILRVRANGAKVYALQYRRNGKLLRSVLGDASKVKLAATRKRAKVLLGRIEAGEDVAAELSRRGCHGGLTCDAFFETFAAARHDVAKWHGRTEATYRGVWKRSIAPRIGKIAVSRVDEVDVEAIVHGCKGKRAAAAGALRLLRAVLNFAEKRKIRPRGSNPVADELICKSPRRLVSISAEEYRRIGAAIDAAEKGNENELAISPHVALALRLLALTGARKLEICAAKWSFYDAADAALRLPESKTGPKVVVVPAAGRRLLAEAQRVPGNEYIICGYRPAGRAGNVDRAWYRIREAAGLPKLRIHDLRHGFASVAVREKVPYASVACALGHSLPGVTGRYVHVSATDVRPQVEIIGAWIADALAGRIANVLPFPDAAVAS